MPGMYRLRHYLESLSNQSLMGQAGSSRRVSVPQCASGPHFLWTRLAAGGHGLPSLTPRDGGAYDPLLGTTQ
jgi:hypothetical protein